VSTTAIYVNGTSSDEPRIASQEKFTKKGRRKFARKITGEDFILYRQDNWVEPTEQSTAKTTQAPITIKHQLNTYSKGE